MYAILLTLTAYNLFIGLRYILSLEAEMKKETYIYGDHMHSLQHIAITGMMILLSVAMLFGTSNGFELLVYLVYNGTFTFIVFPHLNSEK